jgi:hypothetical protein
MKKLKYIVILLALFSASCSREKLDEIDTNPNIISDAPLNTLLPAAQMTVAQRVVGSLSIVSGYASEHTNFTGINTAVQKYDFLKTASPLITPILEVFPMDKFLEFLCPHPRVLAVR